MSARRIITWSALAGIAVAGVVLLLANIRIPAATWNREILLDGKPARVSIVWMRRPIILDLGHVGMIGGGDWRYDVQVTMDGSPPVKFSTTIEPRGLWKSNGHLYVACSLPGRWLFGRIQDGQVIPIALPDLPGTPEPVNLESPETQESWREDFRQWAR